MICVLVILDFFNVMIYCLLGEILTFYYFTVYVSFFIQSFLQTANTLIHPFLGLRLQLIRKYIQAHHLTK